MRSGAELSTPTDPDYRERFKSGLLPRTPKLSLATANPIEVGQIVKLVAPGPA